MILVSSTHFLVVKGGFSSRKPEVSLGRDDDAIVAAVPVVSEVLGPCYGAGP